VPALFAVYPNAAPATLLGTNKGLGLGHGMATVQFAGRVQLRWKSLLPAAARRWQAASPAPGHSRWPAPTACASALPLVLRGRAAYTLARKDLAATTRRACTAPRETATGLPAIGAVVGFYDGFFGPGTGSFFVFLFVRTGTRAASAHISS
jgi:uncharacterized membrane protein YfcA